MFIPRFVRWQVSLLNGIRSKTRARLSNGPDGPGPGPRAPESIINKTVQIPMGGLNIESIVFSFLHNTFQTGKGVIGAVIPVTASSIHCFSYRTSPMQCLVEPNYYSYNYYIIIIILLTQTKA